MLAVWWHVFYLIGMGIGTTFLLLSKIDTLSKDTTYSYGTTDIPVNVGFQLFSFGALVGAVDYLGGIALSYNCLLYTSPSPRDRQKSRMPSSA